MAADSEQRPKRGWEAIPTSGLIRDPTDGPFTEEETRKVAKELIDAGAMEAEETPLGQLRVELNDVACLYQSALDNQKGRPSPRKQKQLLNRLIRNLSKAERLLSNEQRQLGVFEWLLHLHYPRLAGEERGAVGPYPDSRVLADRESIERMLNASQSALEALSPGKAGNPGLDRASRVLVSSLADLWERYTGTRAAVYREWGSNEYPVSASTRFIIGAACVAGAILGATDIAPELEAEEPARRKRREELPLPPA